MDGYHDVLSPEDRDNLLWWTQRREEAAMVNGPAAFPAPSQLPARVLDSAGGIIAGSSTDRHAQYLSHSPVLDNTLEQSVSSTSASASSQGPQSYHEQTFNHPPTSRLPPVASSTVEDIDAVCEEDVGQSYLASNPSHFTQNPGVPAFQDENTMHASDRRTSGAYSSLYQNLPLTSSRRSTNATAGVPFPPGLHAYQAIADEPSSPSRGHPPLSAEASKIPRVHVPQIPIHSQAPNEPIRPQADSQPAASTSYHRSNNNDLREDVDASSDITQSLDRKGKRKAVLEESPENPSKKQRKADTVNPAQSQKEQDRDRGKRNRNEDKDRFEKLRAVIPEEAFRKFVGPQYRKYRWEVLVVGCKYILELRKENEELQRRAESCIINYHKNMWVYHDKAYQSGTIGPSAEE